MVKKNFYHGKVFRINTENSSYILYGSSNCTLSALAKTYHDGRNIEFNIYCGRRNKRMILIISLIILK